MDAFSLLKFWRSGGGFGGGRALTGLPGGGSPAPSGDSSSGVTTIFAVTSPHSSDSDAPPESDGPFIDLEFAAVPEDKVCGNDDDDDREKADQCKNSQHAGDDDGSGSDESYGENEGEGVLNLTFSTSSGSSVDRADPYSSDDIFLNAGGGFESSDAGANSKFPASLVKTATKFRVLMLKLKKPRANAEKSEPGGTSNPEKRSQKDEDEQKSNADDSQLNSGSCIVVEEKKFSKETVEKYLNFVKPFYVRVSKRYGEKLGFSGPLESTTTKTTVEKGETDPAKMAEKSSATFSGTGVKQLGLRVVREHLMKSRSAVVSSGQGSPRRRDDSLLQQQDGIQGAILHCKRSFNSARDSNLCSLSRTTSEISSEKPVHDSAIPHSL